MDQETKRPGRPVGRDETLAVPESYAIVQQEARVADWLSRVLAGGVSARARGLVWAVICAA